MGMRDIYLSLYIYTYIYRYIYFFTYIYGGGRLIEFSDPTGCKSSLSGAMGSRGNPNWKCMDLSKKSWIFRDPTKSLWTWTPARHKHLAMFFILIVAVLSRAKSETLVLAPLIFMRVHGSFEI